MGRPTDARARERRDRRSDQPSETGAGAIASVAAVDKRCDVTARSRVAGNVALVTGATAGIGLATARRLVADGASVMTAARSRDRARRALADLDPEHAAFEHVDVTDEESVAALIEATPSALRSRRLPV
jgi:shikimate 5-dehydrogenase